MWIQKKEQLMQRSKRATYPYAQARAQGPGKLDAGNYQMLRYCAKSLKLLPHRWVVERTSAGPQGDPQDIATIEKLQIGLLAVDQLPRSPLHGQKKRLQSNHLWWWVTQASNLLNRIEHIIGPGLTEYIGLFWD